MHDLATLKTMNEAVTTARKFENLRIAYGEWQEAARSYQQAQNSDALGQSERIDNAFDIMMSRRSYFLNLCEELFHG